MNIWVFVLSIAIIVLCLLLFYLYKWYNSSNLITRPISLKNNSQTIQNLINPNIGTFSISIWIYANSLTNPYSSGKPGNMIYYFTLPTSYMMYQLYFDNNTLYFDFTYGTTITKANSYIITTNFPVQEWTNIVVNVTRDNIFEFFINGKLEQTYNNTTSDKYYVDINSMVVGSCVDDIYITNLQRWDHTRDAASIWNNYLNGLGFSLPTYNATLTYKQDSKIIQQNSLFSNSYK